MTKNIVDNMEKTSTIVEGPSLFWKLRAKIKTLWLEKNKQEIMQKVLMLN